MSNSASQLELFSPTSNYGPANQSVTEIRGDDYSFLRASTPPFALNDIEISPVSVVDLFCGAGGLTLGLWEAIASLGRQMRVRYAADFEQAPLACYKKNVPVDHAECVDLRDIFEADLTSPLSPREKDLLNQIGSVDLLVGGPPCQGHSDLNNYSRRDDLKNHLYKIMGRAAAVLNPKHIIIENVPGAAHDRSKSVSTTIDQLKALNYYVNVGVVDALHLGVPQSRKRLIVIASKTKDISVSDIFEKYRCPIRDVEWAIRDLENEREDSIASISAKSVAATKKRINYLFDNEIYELPDDQRPACHQSGNHSYKSVYGRLRWDQPSQTITSGFYSMCMGRYVHPSLRRTLTAHEAARLQFMPDYYDLSPAGSRTALAKIVGNLVPPKMAFPFVRELLC